MLSASHETSVKSVLGLLGFGYLVTVTFIQSMTDDMRKPIKDRRIA